MNPFKFLNNSIKKNLSSDVKAFLYHSRNYLGGKVIIGILTFFSIPLLTRMLSKSEYGYFAIFDSLISITIIFASLGIHGAFSRYYYEKKSDYNEFVFSNLVWLAGFSVFLLFSIFAFSSPLAAFIDIPEKLLIIAVITAILSVPFQWYLGYLQASKQSKTYNFVFAAREAAILGLTLLLIYLLKQNRYYGRAWAFLLVSVIFFPLIIILFLRISKFNFNFKHVKYSLHFGIPLIPHMISGFILGYFDRIIINQLEDSSKAGVYSLAYSIGMIMNMVVMAMNKSWVPIFYDLMKKNSRKRIINLAQSYTKYTLIFALTLVFFSKELVTIFAHKNFHEAFKILPIIIISYVMVYFYTLYGNFNFYHKKNWMISMGTIIAGTTNIVLNYLFIPVYGYMAAAWTTLFSYFLLAGFNYLIVRFYLKDKAIIPLKVIGKLFPVFLGFVALGLAVEYKLDLNFFVQILLKLVILALYFAFTFKKIILKMISR